MDLIGILILCFMGLGLGIIVVPKVWPLLSKLWPKKAEPTGESIVPIGHVTTVNNEEIAVFVAWCAQRDMLIKKGAEDSLERHIENLSELFGSSQ